MDRLRLIRTLATSAPHLSLREALDLADAIHAEFSTPKQKPIRTLYDLTSTPGRAAYARTLPAVMSNLPDRKIQAIKELRTALVGVSPGHSGLKECKDAVDLITQEDYPPRYNY